MYLTKEEALKEIKAVKQCNKVVRERRAIKRGYKSAEEYLKALQQVVDEKDQVISTDAPTIYVVDILDVSGSMTGSRINAALEGLNSGVKALKQEQKQKPVKYLHLLTTFNTTVHIGKVKPINEVSSIHSGTTGTTALNDAIGLTLERILNTRKNDNEKILINIYTDGGENASRKFNSSSIKELIKSSEEQGVTVTFIGTKYDVESSIQNYGLKKGNTVSYDGSAEGLSKTLLNTVSARSVYTDKVIKGEDVSDDFYKEY